MEDDKPKRRAHPLPEADENTSYKEATTVTHDAHPPCGSPPQESGTMRPKT
jgi:hypothetical protein